jgi:hypothetical protein
MLILNFAHPLSQEQRAQLAGLLNCDAQELDERQISTQIDREADLRFEVERLVNSVGFSNDEWQTRAFVINPPGLSVAAQVLTAELHGRCGHFPTLLHIAPVGKSTPTVFEVREVLNLQVVRDTARAKR